MSFMSFSFMSAGNMDAYYYKCSDGVHIKKGVYHDALEDCAKSNSSIQTYLEQVFNSKSVKNITPVQTVAEIHVTWTMLASHHPILTKKL